MTEMLVQRPKEVLPVGRRERFRLPIFAGKGIEREMGVISTAVEQAARHNEPVLLAEIGPGNGPELTINACTHGDETIGLEILATLLQNTDISKGTLRLTIANTPAVIAGKRFIGEDLNRIAPGNASEDLEMGLAPKLLEILDTGNPDSFVIDLHTASVESPAFAIVNRPDKEALQLAEQTGLDRIVLMQSEDSPKSGAVTDNVPCGIGIELGKHGDERAYKDGIDAVQRVLHCLGMTQGEITEPTTNRNYYKITGSVPRDTKKTIYFSDTFRNFDSVAEGQALYFSSGPDAVQEVGMAAKPFTPILISTLPTNSLFLIGQSVDREAFLPRNPDVLFICQANVGRSQMAEAYFNQFAQGRLVAKSAGVVDLAEKYQGHPTQEIISAMQEEGIDVSKQNIKVVTKDMVNAAKRIIVLCSPEECPEFVQMSDKVTYLTVPDPFGMGLEGTREVRDKIKGIVQTLVTDEEFLTSNEHAKIQVGI